MKIAHFVIPDSTITALGVVVGDALVDIRAAWALGGLEVALSNSLTETLCLNLASGALSELNAALHEMDLGELQDGRYVLASVELLAPLQPRSFRDFYAFEAHVRNARRNRGLEMQPEWYEQPVFYFSNAACIVGPNEPIRKPPDTQALDYELEWAAVIGKQGRDIPAEAADEYIAGFTILNDWSARDLQRREMAVGLGPAKGKDFATSIGPFLVTPDELADRAISNPRRRVSQLQPGDSSPGCVGAVYDLVMTAAVNGVEYSRGNAREMHWTWAELIAQASRNTVLQPGDLIGSGTVGTGCILEFPAGTHPWLQPGDVVRLEVERLGVLENGVVG